MAFIFWSKLDIKSMISILRVKIPSIEWSMGDSHWEGFYVRGRTKDGIKIKITEEDEPGNYYLGIYFYGTNHAFGPVRKLVVNLVLQWRVMRAIGARKID
jgi:hypothetical protein